MHRIFGGYCIEFLEVIASHFWSPIFFFILQTSITVPYRSLAPSNVANYGRMLRAEISYVTYVK